MHIVDDSPFSGPEIWRNVEITGVYSRSTYMRDIERIWIRQITKIKVCPGMFTNSECIKFIKKIIENRKNNIWKNEKWIKSMVEYAEKSDNGKFALNSINVSGRITKYSEFKAGHSVTIQMETSERSPVAIKIFSKDEPHLDQYLSTCYSMSTVNNICDKIIILIDCSANYAELYGHGINGMTIFKFKYEKKILF